MSVASSARRSCTVSSSRPESASSEPGSRRAGSRARPSANDGGRERLRESGRAPDRGRRPGSIARRASSMRPTASRASSSSATRHASCAWRRRAAGPRGCVRRSARSASSTSSPRRGAAASISSIAERSSSASRARRSRSATSTSSSPRSVCQRRNASWIVAEQHRRTRVRRTGRAPRAAPPPSAAGSGRTARARPRVAADLGQHADRRRPSADDSRGCGPPPRPSEPGRGCRGPARPASSSPPGFANALGDRTRVVDLPVPLDARPAGARSGSRRRPRARRAAAPSAVTTMVLPAPVSPVSAVNPGPSGQPGLADDAEIADRDLFDHGRCRLLAPDPRHPSTGRRELVARAGR